MYPDRWAAMLREAAAERAEQPRRICELCVDMLGLSGAGISLVTAEGNHGVVCATDPVAQEIERLQLTLGEGPCVDAAGAQSPVLVPDLARPEGIDVGRWPVFLPAAQGAGAAAIFAFPLLVGAVSVGVLDMYRATPGELTRDELPAALMAADAAALAVLDREVADGGAPGVDDGTSFYNPLLHQATGMVMVQLGVSSPDAFLALRARAFAAGRPLSAVAADVVARRLRLSKEDT